MYLGLGLAGLGMAIAITFVIKSHVDDHRSKKKSKDAV
jgi:hypothetical protein